MPRSTWIQSTNNSSATAVNFTAEPIPATIDAEGTVLKVDALEYPPISEQISEQAAAEQNTSCIAFKPKLMAKPPQYKA